MKKIIAAALVLALLTCLTTALAGNAGSPMDPLVTVSYMEGTYSDALLAKGDQAITDLVSAAQSGDPQTVTVDVKRDYITVQAGSAIELRDGCSLVLLTGSMSVSVQNGSVLEISTATDVPSGTVLTPYLRYFCVEDTAAVYTAVETASVMVDGGFISDGVTPVINHYTDVAAGDWFYPAAVFAQERNIFPDSTDSTFKPYEAVSRAFTVYALWVTVGCPEPTVSAGFSDLTEEWYRKAVDWSVENSIINGADDNCFDPDGGLQRQQMAVILYRYTQCIGGDVSPRADLSTFVDAEKIANWADEEVSWAAAMGILNGVEGNAMSPETPAARCQLATVLMRYVG